MKPQIVNVKMNKLLNRANVVKVSIFLAIVASIALMTGGLYSRNSVYVTDNGITKEIKTNETDVYSILREEGYSLGENDRVDIRKDENGSAHITVNRAFPVSITADGKTTTVELAAGTVDYALRKAGITLGEDDKISCGTDEEVYSGMEITVTRIKKVQKVTTEAIPFTTKYVDTDEQEIGYEEVVTKGEDGSRRVIVTETYTDGVLTDTVTRRNIEKSPVNEVVERGTAEPVEFISEVAAPSSLNLVGGIPKNYARVVSGKATAYTAPAGSLTASGRYAQVGHVAVNPNVIPYGSELYIVAQDGSKAYGYCIAADTGGAMMDGRAVVDLFMDTYEDCCEWGAVYVDIYVLSEGNG